MPLSSVMPTRLSRSRSISPTAFDLILVSSVWILMALLVNPTGEFPLNDDWSYSQAVRSLVDEGTLRFTGFTSMPLLAQVLWGALFCLPFGFSFTALRFSTLLLGFVGILATYGLLKEVKANRTITLIGTMLVAINPLYFQLSFTFMTDVPFFAFSMLAFFCFMRGIRRERILDLLLGIFFSLVTILIRQLGIIIPLSFAIAYLVKEGVNRKTIQSAFVPAGILSGILVAYEPLLRSTVGLPVLYNRSYEPILESATGFFQIPLIFTDRLLVESIYLGLFTLPFTIVLAINGWKMALLKRRLLSVLVSSALLAAVMGGLLWNQRIMPLSGNILFDIGLGPVLLRDVYLLRLPHLPSAPRVLWLIITTAGVFGGLLLIRNGAIVAQLVVKLVKSQGQVDKFPIILSLVACTLYVVVIAVTGFLDRYLIWPLPLVMIVTVAAANSIPSQVSTFSIAVASILLLVYGLFTVAASHDYLSWNRARWQALHDLMEQDHISYSNIDGGFEFNGWYAYDPKYRETPPKSWWWVHNDNYIISFGSIAGYEETKRYSYQRWIPFGQGNVFVLHKSAH